MMIRPTLATRRLLPHTLSLVLALVTLSGCIALLPRSESGAKSQWANFDTATENFNRIKPYETDKSQLLSLGMDPVSNPNVTILNYSDVIRRFIPSSAVPRKIWIAVSVSASPPKMNTAPTKLT